MTLADSGSLSCCDRMDEMSAGSKLISTTEETRTESGRVGLESRSATVFVCPGTYLMCAS